jgi:hypothetical protein
MSDDRLVQMANEGFEVTRIQIHQGTHKVVAVVYRYVGVEEEEQSEPKVEAKRRLTCRCDHPCSRRTKLSCRKQFLHAHEPLPSGGYQLWRFGPRLVILWLLWLLYIYSKFCFLKLFLLNACKMLLNFLGTENAPNFRHELR